MRFFPLFGAAIMLLVACASAPPALDPFETRVVQTCDDYSSFSYAGANARKLGQIGDEAWAAFQEADRFIGPLCSDLDSITTEDLLGLIDAALQKMIDAEAQNG